MNIVNRGEDTLHCLGDLWSPNCICSKDCSQVELVAVREPVRGLGQFAACSNSIRITWRQKVERRKLWQARMVSRC